MGTMVSISGMGKKDYVEYCIKQTVGINTCSILQDIEVIVLSFITF